MDRVSWVIVGIVASYASGLDQAATPGTWFGMETLIRLVAGFFSGWWRLATTEDPAYEEDPGRNL